MAAPTIDQDALSKALISFFARKQEGMQCSLSDEVSVYTADENQYWAGHVRTERFADTLQPNGMLYRPTIVNEICSRIDTILDSKVKQGLMVKGPQGIGKSHSLVNVVRKLESTGYYLVTFFPDCDSWSTAFFFIQQVCYSFGMMQHEMNNMGIRRVESSQYEDMVEDLIERIDSILAEMDKKWVFIFDQINRLFVRPVNRVAADVGSLSFPHNLVTRVRKKGRITSVIAASANNEMAYKEHHEGFVEYNHRTDMIEHELRLLFEGKGINDMNVRKVIDSSGGVPLYAMMYARNPQTFQDEVNDSVSFSLDRLRPSNEFQIHEWTLVRDSIFSSIFGTTSSSKKYDKKFLVREQANEAGTVWRYKALFPAVLAAYRQHLWNDLIKYVEENEVHFLEVCRSHNTTNDTRGRLFEAIVIRRCQSHGVTIVEGREDKNVGPCSFGFAGNVLPEIASTSRDCIHIPYDPNFPAVDLILKIGRSVFGVQVHVGVHPDVAPSFFGLCRTARWFENFDTVNLVYLAPEDDVTDLVRGLVEPPVYAGTKTRSFTDDTAQYRIHRRAISKDSFQCLRNLVWPSGCSLP